MGIRVATQSDVDDIVQIYQQINIKTMKTDVKFTKSDFEKHVDNSNIYVYDIDKIVGFILFYDHITWAYIEVLCVDKNFRGNGIGNKLLNTIKNESWNRIELCCHISDVDVINFVEKCNFIPSDQITSWYYK